MAAESATPAGRGPVGQGDYVVREGDCIGSIAKQHGHFWETLWTEPANAELRRVRGDPNILFPGDRVTIPPIRLREEQRPTDQRHRFIKRGEPAKLRLRLLEERRDEQPAADAPPPRYVGRDVYTEDPPAPPSPLVDRPRKNVPYVLSVDGEVFRGRTDADGYLEAWISPTATTGRLLLNPGTAGEEDLVLNLGHLDPIDEIAGVKQRLANLAFDCGDRTNEMTPGLRDALLAFQDKHGLQATGELTDEVRRKLRDLHRS
jgi:hypothetical protein